MLLQDKRIVVMGLLDARSIAWAIGTRAAAEGAQVTYTVQSERFRDVLLRRSFKGQGLNVDDYDIRCCDVTKDDELKALFDSFDGPIDGLVHSIGYAKPETCLAETMFQAPRADAMLALEVSAASLVFVAGAAREKLRPGGSIVAMTFDAQHTWPHYNWMGVCKATLEACAKYLSRDLGPQQIRVNCVSAGPLRTMAATHIPAFTTMESAWPGRAPLGWDSVEDRHGVADGVVFLLSDLSRRVTGEVLYVDGGFHTVAVPAPEKG